MLHACAWRPRTCVAAALALLRLCATSDDAEVIARERAMDWLREAMQRFPDNAEITEHAASLLAVLDGFRAKNSRVEKDKENHQRGHERAKTERISATLT